MKKEKIKFEILKKGNASRNKFVQFGMITSTTIRCKLVTNLKDLLKMNNSDNSLLKKKQTQYKYVES